MPELPEVETVTKALRQNLLGAKFVDVQTHVEKLRYPLLLVLNRDFLHQPIIDIRRRAKYIVLEFGNNLALLMHLGMTGSFRLESSRSERRKHDHVELFLSEHEVLRFNDPRRFGFIQLCHLREQGANPDELPNLAPEPLSHEFDLDWLQQVCRGRVKPIKNVIMDNALVVGVGNIYASEALFRAGIRPTKKAGKISKPRLNQLLLAIKEVLNEAIEAGGTTIQNFTSLNSEVGYFARALNVYDKEGATCVRCKNGIIQRVVLGGRSTYYCADCQK